MSGARRGREWPSQHRFLCLCCSRLCAQRHASAGKASPELSFLGLEATSLPSEGYILLVFFHEKPFPHPASSYQADGSAADEHMTTRHIGQAVPPLSPASSHLWVPAASLG